MSLPDLLTPAEVSRLARSLTNIESLDRAIAHMASKAKSESGETPVLMDELGDSVRGILGRNHLPQFTDERLGLVVLAAVINALLYERDLQAREVEGFVLVSEPLAEPVALGDIWARFEKGARVDVEV